MKLDRVAVGLLVLMTLSGAAMAAGLLSQGDEVSQVAMETPPEDIAPQPLTLADCELMQDPDDPKRLETASDGRPTSPMKDQEVVDAVATPDGADYPYFQAYRAECPGLVAGVADPEGRARLEYGLARMEMLTVDKDAARTRLLAIKTYPAAAYQLGKMEIEGGNVLIQPPDSKEFMDTMALLKTAYDGGDKRAEYELRRMMQRYYPFERFELPGLVAALLSDDPASIPDTHDTRTALVSFFDAYRRVCTQTTSMTVTPGQDRARKNFLLTVQAKRWADALNAIPTELQKFREALGSSSNHNLVGLIRIWNTASAKPAELIFVMDQAAERDGVFAAEVFTCRGPRATKVMNNLYGLFETRENGVPEPPSEAAMKTYSVQPDVLTM